MDGIVRTFKLSAALPAAHNSAEIWAGLILNALARKVLGSTRGDGPPLTMIAGRAANGTGPAPQSDNMNKPSMTNSGTGNSGMSNSGMNNGMNNSATTGMSKEGMSKNSTNKEMKKDSMSKDMKK
jgi:hypothetical protein